MAAPVNDNLANAIALDITGQPPITASNVEATTEIGEDLTLSNGEPGFETVDHSLWYYFDATTAQFQVDTIGSDFDTALQVYSGPAGATSFGQLVQIAENDQGGGSNTSLVTFNAVLGRRYYVQVSGIDGSTETGTIKLRAFSPAGPSQPPNNDLANAIVVTSGRMTGDNVAANVQTGEDLSAGPNVTVGSTVWYLYEPDISGTDTFTTVGSDFDTTLQVFSTTSANPTFADLTQVAENDDTGGTVQSSITFASSAGTRYYIQVGGFNTNKGSVSLNLSSTAPGPAITSAGAISVGEGTGGTIYQTATDTPSATLTYSLSGADAARFNISAAGALSFATAPDYEAPVDAGANNVYDVVITASDGIHAPSSKAVAITVTDVLPPATDALANAIAIAPGTLTGSNVEATTQAGEDLVIGSSAVVGRSVWDTYQPTSSGQVKVDTIGSSFDTTLQVFSGPDAVAGATFANLVQIGENDDISLGDVRQSGLTFSAVAGTRYYFQVGGYKTGSFDERGAFQLNLAAPDDDNFKTGSPGDDTLDGGLGNDTVAGGPGNDTYYVDSTGDVVIENAGEGTDTVFSTVTFSLAGQFAENLTLTGTAIINGTGNGLDNFLTGNAANNRLDGGTAGNDTLDGGLGIDTMVGGIGNDTYYVNDAQDVASEGQNAGTDTVVSAVTYSLAGQFLENLTLTGTAANGTGNGLDNYLTGNAGNNRLDGGTAGNDTLVGGGGVDTMVGGTGNDTYYVDDAQDQVFESQNAGIDTVMSSATISLAGQFVENLTLIGTAPINGTGNSLDNTVTGNTANNRLDGGSAGNDTLDGGGGADTMVGGTGNDTYYVDNTQDTAFESQNGGTDTVVSKVVFSLAGQYLENLTLTGTATNGTGNGLDNALVGNAASNRLDGLAGNDTLNGGLGADTLTGDAGLDTYVFSSALGAGNVDTITSFSVVDDTIQLSAAIFGLPPGPLSPNAFRDVGLTPRDADDRILYVSATGALYLDTDGSGPNAAVQFATLTNHPANLSAADFLVV